MKKTHWFLVLSVLVIVWLSISLVRVENQRYAMSVGMCEDKGLLIATQQISWDFNCLSKVQTRTSWVGHLFYALTD